MIPTINTFADPKIKRLREMIWEKDYNAKLQGDGFVHIDLAPKQMPAAQLMEETVFVISTKEVPEKKHFFRLIHINIIKEASLLPEHSIAASHGTDAATFFDAMFSSYPGKFNWNTPMALYFYLRVKPL